MKRILIVSNLYPSEKDPTFGTFVKNFVDEIGENMPDVKVEKSVIRGRTSSPINKVWKYVKFYTSTFFKILFGDFNLIYVHYVSHSIPPIWLASLFKHLQIAFNIHGDDLLVRSRQGRFFLNLAKPLMLTSELIVVPSPFFTDLLKDSLPGIPSGTVFVSPSGGINSSFFSKPILSSADSLKIGYVSRIDEGKGWDVLLKAVKLLISENVKVQAIIIGFGAQIDAMKMMINELGLTDSVDYLGPKSHDELPHYYQTFDLFVFPTMLQESLGLVGIEAMACGTPVIGSRIGGITTYIDDSKNGYMFEPGNSEDLKYKVLEYLDLDSQGKMLMKEAAYKTALNYEAERVSSALFRRISELYNI